MSDVSNGPSPGAPVRHEIKVKVILADSTVEVHTVEVTNATTAPGTGGQGGACGRASVLFLHSGRFTSQHWLDLGTLDQVVSAGYRAVAIDLPGKGQTPQSIDRTLNADFLDALVQAKGLSNLVIVSPSSSGRYSLPYLFRDAQSSTGRALGFVPIAPGGSKDFRDKYSESKLQTLIVYGTDDPEGPTILEDLKLLPKSEIFPLVGAGHACYMDQPAVFHEALLGFLGKLAV
ncbi:hypothetical protein EGW08_016770 [Elysia chlorotica]|uniref:AB hydrolase-1 domain-containing protein n=1 Tax=Elysia chlorotica TaxID=188477 RepID=A0A3S0ZI93_ELYCH|nr:hypothetical protein EGW08_016770 [Elysia chlorotica]